MRVSVLADDLGVNSKDIRKFLRSKYGSVGTGGRWNLDSQQVEAVRWRFEGAGRGLRTTRGPRTTWGSNIPLLVRKHAGPSIVDKVRQLQVEPQDIHIKVVESDEDLVFHRIINSWQARGRRTAGSQVVLLSNGEFKEGEELKGISSWLLESQYCLIRRGERYYAHHVNYVQSLSEVSIPQWLIPSLIERPQSTSRDDTPLELLISDYASHFSSKLVASSILKWEHGTGTTLGKVSLRELELWELEFRGVSILDPQIGLMFARYFATINLLQEHPQHSSAFEITLGELFRRFYIEIGERAEGLRRDIVSRLGFEECNEGWRKRKGGDEVFISNDLRVHINKKFVCIVSAKSSNLPLDDEVARRMLTVATTHRDQIYTIKGETKEALERLFPIGERNSSYEKP